MTDWQIGTPDEIVSDITRVTESLQAAPTAMMINPHAHIWLLRQIKDPYERLMRLYNAGCRGKDLR